MLVALKKQECFVCLFDSATARLRLDKQKPQTFIMGKSTDGEALFFPSGEAILRAMLAAEHLVFEFTPFSTSLTEMTFDLRGNR